MLNASVLDQYPGVDTDAVQALLEEKCRQDRHKIIVLDDDPTGVQTVHDVSVYTDWSYESIFRFLKSGLIPMNKDDIDLLENYVIAYGIKGYKWRLPEWLYGFSKDSLFN